MRASHANVTGLICTSYAGSTNGGFVRVSIRFLCFFLFTRKKNVMSSGHYTTSVFASFYEKEERNVQWTLNDCQATKVACRFEVRHLAPLIEQSNR